MNTLFGMIKGDTKLLFSGAHSAQLCVKCKSRRVGVDSVQAFVDQLQTKFQWSKVANWLRQYTGNAHLAVHVQDQLKNQKRLSRGIRNKDPIEMVQALFGAFEKALLDAKE